MHAHSLAHKCGHTQRQVMHADMQTYLQPVSLSVPRGHLATRIQLRLITIRVKGSNEGKTQERVIFITGHLHVKQSAIT